MATLNNIGLITVRMADVKKPILDLANDGLRQNTSTITELASIPVDDTAMHTLANKVITEFNQLHAKPPTSTSSNLNVAKNVFITAYNKNAVFIQSAARSASKLAVASYQYTGDR